VVRNSPIADVPEFDPLPARRISTGLADIPVLVLFKRSPVGNWGQGAGMVHFRVRAVRVVEKKQKQRGWGGRPADAILGAVV